MITTAEIVERFRNSWIKTEEFYKVLTNNSQWSKLQPIIQFIASLKEKGYDNHFRLGTSVDTLIISRSVEHGLRYDQKHIKIYSTNNGIDVSLREGEKVYRQYVVDNLEDERVAKLLQTLKDSLVD